jgi:hypothetical protein
MLSNKKQNINPSTRATSHSSANNIFSASTGVGSAEKIKTTVLIDKRLKKLAQMHGIQNDKTLSEVIEEGLERVLGLD